MIDDIIITVIAFSGPVLAFGAMWLAVKWLDEKENEK